MSNFRKTIIALLTVSMLFLPTLIAAKQPLVVNRLPNFIDKVSEGISLLFRFSPQSKIDYMQQLLEKRLAEIEFVNRNNDIDVLEITTSRYSTYMGKIMALTDAHRPASLSTIQEFYQNHLGRLEKIQSKFEHDSGWWLMLQHNINLLNIALSKLKS